MKRFLCGYAVTFLLPVIALAAENCHSITDRYCYGTPLISERSIKVSVKIGASGESSYELKDQTPSEEDYSLYCPGSKCTCKADVQYLHFEGSSAAIAKINAKEKQEADREQCSLENAFIIRRPDFVYTSANMISTAIFDEEYCRTCGGGCHGNTSLATYNVDTGQKYILDDIIYSSELSKLQDDLKTVFITRYVPADRLEYVNKFLQKDIASNVKPNSDFYVERGEVYLNINSFTLGCSNGSFYPVPIPTKYIRPTFLKILGTSE